jgi:hypothetical protein
MTVYVLIVGLYDPEVRGVYSSLIAAQRAADNVGGGTITDWRQHTDGSWWGTPLGEVCVRAVVMDAEPA